MSSRSAHKDAQQEIRQSLGSLQRSNTLKSPGFLLLLDAIALLLHAGGTRAQSVCLADDKRLHANV
jgi:hypothetical protein